jgi:aspartyl protease family protein
MFILAWVFAFVILVVFFANHEKSSNQLIQMSATKVQILADKQGHYRFKGKINDFDVNFLVDTGASSLAIPIVIAKKLSLTKYYPVEISTASGKATGYLTRVDSIQIGSNKLTNIRAVILPNDTTQYVLLGMNVLKDLTMTLKNKTLTIEFHKN